MKKKTGGLVLGALALTVGFAAVSTTLYINGTATIKANDENFRNNVIFTSAFLNDVEITDTAISADGRTITFTTPEFTNIGDSATLEYSVLNKSDYYAEFEDDAIECVATEGLEEDFDTYLIIEEGGALDGVVLDRQDMMYDTLTVGLWQSYVGDNPKTITYQCTINVNALESKPTVGNQDYIPV